MKPSKMRNRMIHAATYQVKSKQLGSALSKDLHRKYGKRSVRVVSGDGITILRGEFKGVDGKVSKVSIQKSSVAIEGVKKEKTKGDKFDVYIHTSNILVTSLNSEDRWRILKLEGSDPKKQSKKPRTAEKKAGEAPKQDSKETKAEGTPKQAPKETKAEEAPKQAPKETKVEEAPKQTPKETKEEKKAEKREVKD